MVPNVAPLLMDHILIVLSQEPDAIVSRLTHSRSTIREVCWVRVLWRVQTDLNHILTLMSSEALAMSPLGKSFRRYAQLRVSIVNGSLECTILVEHFYHARCWVQSCSLDCKSHSCLDAIIEENMFHQNSPRRYVIHRHATARLKNQNYKSIWSSLKVFYCKINVSS